MTPERRSLLYGHSRIDYLIVPRPRKTLEIAVEPDTSVVVAAPIEATIEAIEELLRKRAA
jgi:predicted metal-dependent hydrolase